MPITDFESYAKAVYDYNQSNPEKIYLFSLQSWTATDAMYSQLAMQAYGKIEKASCREAIETLKSFILRLKKILSISLCFRMKKYYPVLENFFRKNIYLPYILHRCIYYGRFLILLVWKPCFQQYYLRSKIKNQRSIQVVTIYKV